MRELENSELSFVAGAGVGVCDISEAVETFSSGPDVGQALINIYEGLVDATSHIIGRVANDLHPSYYR